MTPDTSEHAFGFRKIIRDTRPHCHDRGDGSDSDETCPVYDLAGHVYVTGCTLVSFERIEKTLRKLDEQWLRIIVDLKAIGGEAADKLAEQALRMNVATGRTKLQELAREFAEQLRADFLIKNEGKAFSSDIQGLRKVADMLDIFRRGCLSSHDCEFEIGKLPKKQRQAFEKLKPPIPESSDVPEALFNLIKDRIETVAVQRLRIPDTKAEFLDLRTGMLGKTNFDAYTGVGPGNSNSYLVRLRSLMQSVIKNSPIWKKK
jgi:hypothetical protein